MAEFKDRIKDLRIARRLRQHDMDDKLGLGHGNYCRYELGIRQPDLSTLVRMAEVFNVSLDYLVCRVDTPYYIINKSDGSITASTDDPTTMKPEPVLITDLQWMPRTKQEFKSYILQIMKEQGK